MEQATYPTQFSLEYADRRLDRVTMYFRLFVVVLIFIVLGNVWIAMHGWGHPPAHVLQLLAW